MNRTTMLHMGIGFVLALAGAAMLYVSKGDVKTSAQGTTPYSSTWTANSVLTVDARVGSSQVGQAILGVWGWQVTGTVGTSKTFTETWVAPSISGISFTPAAQGCTLVGVSATDFAAGCFADQDNIGSPDTSTYTFAVRPPSEVTSTKARLNAGSGVQRTTSCINSPRNTSEDECLFQSGSYAFQHVHEPGFPGRTRWLGGGVLMPLKWTVTGTVTDR